MKLYNGVGSFIWMLDDQIFYLDFNATFSYIVIKYFILVFSATFNYIVIKYLILVFSATFNYIVIKYFIWC